MTWAILNRSENQLDGKREHLCGRYCHGTGLAPPELSGYKTAVFKTRALARQYMKEHFTDLRTRGDLRSEPHGWKAPKIVKVRVTVGPDVS